MVLKKTKRESWEEFGRRLELGYKGNQKMFYRIEKSKRRQNQRLGQMRSHNGDLVKNKEEEIVRIF